MISRAIIALAVAFIAIPADADERALVFSTLPFDDAAAQHSVFNLLSRQLAAKLGRPVIFQAGDNYETVINDLRRGKVDVALLGAASYIKARRSGDVRAILRAVRHRQSIYHGVVIVKRDSGLRTLADLKGKRFAFVDPDSTAGYLFTKKLLLEAGLDPNKDLKTEFAGGHHKVVRKVAAGEVDAGACFEGAAEMLDDPQSVTTIARTAPITGDPVVVRPGLGSDLVNALRSAMIELSVVPEARGFFTFSEIDGFIPAVDSDYDSIELLIREAGG